jgi:plastocyanin
VTPRLRLVVAGVVVAAAAAGCSSAGPNWSITPPAPSPTAAASAAVASSAPGGSAPATPAPQASTATGSSTAPATGGSVLSLAAKNIAFDPSSLTATANTPFTIHFDNQDTGVGHDVAIHQGSAGGPLEFQGQVIVGPSSVDYQVPALPPGTYTVVCIIHPTQMVATLTVK